jgi:multiple sugar transport system substrate-binding protein
MIQCSDLSATMEPVCSALSRRRLLRWGRNAVYVALLPLTSTGCRLPGKGEQPSTQQAPATITFLGRGSQVYMQTFEELVQRFQQQFPHVTVQYTHETGNFDEKYQVLAAAGQTPDVAFSTVAFYKAHVARGVAAYLDDLAKRDREFNEANYESYWLEALRYRGRLAGLPWDPGMVVLFYSRSAFDKAGVPVPDPRTPLTWEDTIERAKALVVQSGGQVQQWGLELWWARFWWQIPRQLGLLDVYLGDENILKLDHPIALEALQWLADLRLKHQVARPIEYAGPAANFGSGTVAMQTSGVWAAGQVRTDLQADWDWAPLPQFRDKQRVTMGQASPLILGASSKAREAAWALMKYLAGPVGQEVAIERGISQPMLKVHYNSPAFTRARPPHNPQVAMEEVRYAVPPPYGPSYLEIQALVDRVMAPVYRGEQSARQAIQSAWPEFQRVLDEAKQRFG